MTKSYILIDRRPVPEPDLLAWGRWFEDSLAACRVAFTEVTPEIAVSTVFLAIDHAFGGDPPLLFETMTFGLCEESEGLDRFFARCSTWQQAETQHVRIAAAVRCWLMDRGA